MKTILICGDRNWNDVPTIEHYLDTLPKDTRIIEGGCRGADEISGWLARKRGFTVIVEKANWLKFGKAAGPIRNQLMLDVYKPDLVVAFHNDLAHSKGTSNMVNLATNQGVPVQIFNSQQTKAKP
jgi:hypothetical protein